MKIAVFGAGGAGGYFGARLAEAGADVTFVARGKHLEAMKTHGLRVDSPDGDLVLNPVKAVDDPARVGVVDAVFLGVKAWQVAEAATALAPMVGPDGVVVPLQNGVEAPRQLAKVVGREHVLGGLCGLISYVVAPGHIRHAGGDPFVKFGELDNRRTERVRRLERRFEGAIGVTASVPEDIEAAMWDKFVLITAWSGLGAITRSPVGVFRRVPETREMLEAVLREVTAVGRARDVKLAAGCVESCLAMIDALPASGTASMQRDIMEGRPSELNQQSGAVVRLGREVGVATPVNSFIYRSLLPLERKARGEIAFD